jgi:tight adherence protein B
VSGVLLCGSLALLFWPGPRSVIQARLADLVGARNGRTAGWVRVRVPARLPFLAGVVAAAFGALSGSVLVALLTGAAGVGAARAWTAARRSSREDARLVALTDALAALAAELRSGRSPVAATAAATATCADEPTGLALARAVRAPDDPGDWGSGPVRQALDRIAAAVAVSIRAGCSLAAVLSAVEDDLRARRRRQLELRSATAGARAGATVLAGLPLLGLAMGSGVGADPWGVLTTTPAGQALLLVGTGLEAAGLMWSRRLVQRAVR